MTHFEQSEGARALKERLKRQRSPLRPKTWREKKRQTEKRKQRELALYNMRQAQEPFARQPNHHTFITDYMRPLHGDKKDPE